MQAKVTGVSISAVCENLAQTHPMVANDSSREEVLKLHPEHPINTIKLFALWYTNGLIKLAMGLPMSMPLLSM